MRNQLLFVPVALTLAVSGCSLLVDPEKNDPATTAEGFCNSVQDVINDLQCDVLGGGGGPGMSGKMAPEASEAFFVELRRSCDELKSAVDQGRYTFDESKVAACVEALEARGCKGILSAGYFNWPAPCAAAIKGTRNPGESCYSMFSSAVQQGSTNFQLNECTQGSRCLYSDYNACPGTCGFDSNVNEPCGLGNRYCRNGQNLYCDYNAYTCRTYAGLNQACSTNGSAYQYCDSNYFYCTGAPGTCQYLPSSGTCSTSYPYCRAGYFCNGSPGTGTCQARPYPPNACALGYVCADGTFCDSGGACRYYQTSEGASCAAPDYCGSLGSQYLYCDGAQTCRFYPTQPLPRGADCTNLGSSYCGDGLYCDNAGMWGPANTCQPQQRSGDCSAGSMEMCAAGTACLWDSLSGTNLCTPLRGLGQSCPTDGMGGAGCLSGLFCDGIMPNPGVCRLLPGAGSPCATTGMTACAPGVQPDWSSGPCMCTSAPVEGEPCAGDGDCWTDRTGLRCLPSGGGDTCQPVTCFKPLGWLGGGGGGPT